MIAFIFLCILVGILAAPFVAIVIMVADRQKLAEMDRLIDAFFANKQSDPEEAARRVKAQLLALKSHLYPGDKRALLEADAKLALIP